LIDIKVKEQSIENMARGRLVYEPARYMTVNECVEELLEIEERRGENVYNKDTIVVGLARIGAEDQKVVSGTMKEMLDVDFGAPLHSFIITGKMHFIEAETLKRFAIDAESFVKHQR
jgi:diphthine methyl ester synthase